MADRRISDRTSAAGSFFPVCVGNVSSCIEGMRCPNHIPPPPPPLASPHLHLVGSPPHRALSRPRSRRRLVSVHHNIIIHPSIIIIGIISISTAWSTSLCGRQLSACLDEAYNNPFQKHYSHSASSPHTIHCNIVQAVHLFACSHFNPHFFLPLSFSAIPYCPPRRPIYLLIRVFTPVICFVLIGVETDFVSSHLISFIPHHDVRSASLLLDSFPISRPCCHSVLLSASSSYSGFVFPSSSTYTRRTHILSGYLIHIPHQSRSKVASQLHTGNFVVPSGRFH